MLTEKEYVDISGSRCPFCNSENIEGGNMDYYGSGVSQEVLCLDCGKRWMDDYSLTGFTEIED